MTGANEHDGTRRPARIVGVVTGVVVGVVVCVVALTGLVSKLGGGGDGGTDAAAVSSGPVGVSDGGSVVVTASSTGSLDEVDVSTVSDPSGGPTSSVALGPADGGPADGGSADGGSVPTSDTDGPAIDPTGPLSDTTLTPITTPFVPGSLATVPVGTVVPEPAVPIDEPATDARAVTVSLTTREAVQGEALGLGEVAGPAVRMEVMFTNGSSRPVSLDAVIVDVVYGADRTSASPMRGPRVVPFSGTLAVGASRVGAFVFDVPVDQRDLVTIIVVRSADAPPVVFEGAFPR